MKYGQRTANADNNPRPAGFDLAEAMAAYMPQVVDEAVDPGQDRGYFPTDSASIVRPVAPRNKAGPACFINGVLYTPIPLPNGQRAYIPTPTVVHGPTPRPATPALDGHDQQHEENQ